MKNQSFFQKKEKKKEKNDEPLQKLKRINDTLDSLRNIFFLKKPVSLIP